MRDEQPHLHRGNDLANIGIRHLSESDPRQIGQFHVHALVGAGGMGKVFLGSAAGRYVAIKQVLPHLADDEIFTKRFGAELDKQSRLPRGVSPEVLATDRVSRPPWFATEYIPGVTVEAAVGLSGGALPLADCWVLLRELAAKLALVAERSMVHRDLKPSNVMITSDGVKLIDFGLAIAAQETRLTQTGFAIGTPPFMAPEQFQDPKNLTPAVDVFALGGVITFAATGSPPFGNDRNALPYQVSHVEPDLHGLDDRDPELAAVVRRCLAKKPGHRPSAAELTTSRATSESTAPAGAAYAWPEKVSDLIARREAFASSPWHSDPAGTARSTRSGSTAADPPPPAPRAVADSERSDKKRRRPLALLMPIVVVIGGSVAAIQVMPHLFEPDEATQHGAATSPSPSVTPTSSPSAEPSTSAKKSAGTQPTPKTRRSRPPGTNPDRKTSKPAPADVDNDPEGGAGGDQPNSTTTTSTALFSDPPGRLRHPASDRCLSLGNTPAMQSCSWSDSLWEAAYADDGTFQLVSDGKCLSRYEEGAGAPLLSGACDGSTGVRWEITSETSAGTVIATPARDNCLTVSANRLNMSPCNGSTSQRWRNGG